jgi:hypothetical protein
MRRIHRCTFYSTAQVGGVEMVCTDLSGPFDWKDSVVRAKLSEGGGTLSFGVLRNALRVQLPWRAAGDDEYLAHVSWFGFPSLLDQRIKGER